MAFAPMFFRLDKGYTEVNIKGDHILMVDKKCKVPLISVRFLGTVHIWDLRHVQERLGSDWRIQH